MARNQPRPKAALELRLEPLEDRCGICTEKLWVAYHSPRTVATLWGLVRLRLVVRRCVNGDCALYHEPYRPEQEGAFALPQGEFGLDVIALVGALRHAEHRSVPEIHRELLGRGVDVSERTVTNLLDRYEELVALRLSDREGLRHRLEEQGRAILAIDGLQPDVGHEVLWVVRECLSGEVLLARSLLGGTQGELVPLLREAAHILPVPIKGVISDGQHAIRKAVESTLPGVPHQLCQFHYLREAAKEVYEADRHAKKKLKKHVRGVRPIERKLEGRNDHEAEAIRGYCLAVRSAITDDGRPPLAASGLKLHERLSAIHGSVERVSKKGNFPEGFPGS
jgi:Transposase, Mutator family